MAVSLSKSNVAAFPALLEIHGDSKGETMYIPVWPSLIPSYFLRSEVPELLPFPLDQPHSTYFYVARNGIYHLIRSFAHHNGVTVLAPDYHHGNEIYAMLAAGAKIRYYPIK